MHTEIRVHMYVYRIQTKFNQNILSRGTPSNFCFCMTETEREFYFHCFINQMFYLRYFRYYAYAYNISIFF